MRRALLVLLLAACGGAEPPPPFTGRWYYGFTDLTGTGGTCSSTVVLDLEQAGERFAGVYAGTLSCTPGGDGIVGGRVIEGRLVGDTVVFTFEGANWFHKGVLAAGTLTGLVNAHVGINTGFPFTLTGTFTATRD